MYSGYGITFDSADWWSCYNGTSRNVIAFGVYSSPSSHAENCKTNFLILDFGPTFGINGSFGSPEQKSCIILLKQIQHFAGVYIIILIIVICLIMEKKYLNLKLTIKMLIFQLNVV